MSEENKLNKEEALNNQTPKNEQPQLKSKLTEENKKEIPFSPISLQLKAQLEHILKDLTKIKEEILTNQNTISGKNSSIKTMLDKLKVSQDVEINEEAIDTFDKTQNNYSALAQFYIQELNFYVSHYEEYLKDEQPEKISIAKEDSSKTFPEYIEKAVKRLKIFAKKRKKDVTILFSRYNHGFDLQLYKLNLVETHLKSYEKNQ